VVASTGCVICFFDFSFAVVAGGRKCSICYRGPGRCAEVFLDSSGQPTGICVESLLFLSEASSSVSITGYDNFLPPKRYKGMLENGHIDIMAGLSYTPERSEKYRFFEPPLYAVRHVVISRKAANIAFHTAADIRDQRLRILTVHGTGSANYAKELFGASLVDDGAQDTHALLRKLRLGRGDLAYYHDLGLYSAARDNRSAEDLQFHQHVFREYAHYLVASRHLPEDEFRMLEGLWQDVARSDEYAAMLRRYGVAAPESGKPMP
jgi:ABC-type amino acid transport substrate-binding protein